MGYNFTVRCSLSADKVGYGKWEERCNVFSHGIGAVIALIGFLRLLYQANLQQQWLAWVSATVFGLGMILMLSSSTIYHFVQNDRWRKWLRRCDHGMIFFFIAATYTSFTLLALSGQDSLHWTLFIWLLAICGIILAFIPLRHKAWIEVPLCLALGWLALFLYGDFSSQLQGGWVWLLAGGIVYSVGALLYLCKRLPFNHAIWHCFVLAGVACHYVAISKYLL